MVTVGGIANFTQFTALYVSWAVIRANAADLPNPAINQNITLTDVPDSIEWLVLPARNTSGNCCTIDHCYARIRSRVLHACDSSYNRLGALAVCVIHRACFTRSADAAWFDDIT